MVKEQLWSLPTTGRAARYKGHRILRCHWAGDPHGGRWYVQSNHETGMTWADEATPHHRTLAEAMEYIDLQGGE